MLAHVHVAPGQKLRVKLPFDPSNRSFMRSLLPERSHLKHTGRGWWECAARHARAVIAGLTAEGYDVQVTVRVAGRRTTEVCDVRCQEALGPDCECSCAGEYHGIRSPGWTSVGLDSSTLVRQGQWSDGHERVYRIRRNPLAEPPGATSGCTEL